MNIFGISDSSVSPSEPFITMSQTDERIALLEQRKAEAINEKQKISSTSSDWFRIRKIEKPLSISVATFKRYIFQETTTLLSLKEKRLKKEHERILALENRIIANLQTIKSFISKEDFIQANKVLGSITQQIQEIDTPSVLAEYQKVVSEVSILENILFQREIKQKTEQEKKQAEQLRLEEERQEKLKLEEEKGLALIEKQREERARKYAEELKIKEKAELTEKTRLLSLSKNKKTEMNDIENLLKANGITCFYHFTDIRNLPSIQTHGGLMSWFYCKKNSIIIPFQGGDDDSEMLDRKYGLEDFVRLSFCNDHPMAWRLQKQGCRLALLRIKIDVAWFRDTLFSDINAADSSHTHGDKLEDLKNVKFSATQRNYVSKNDPDFKLHQAEVMVKTFVPAEYIINLNNPIFIN